MIQIIAWISVKTSVLPTTKMAALDAHGLMASLGAEEVSLGLSYRAALHLQLPHRTAQTSAATPRTSDRGSCGEETWDSWPLTGRVQWSTQPSPQREQSLVEEKHGAVTQMISATTIQVELSYPNCLLWSP